LVIAEMVADTSKDVPDPSGSRAFHFAVAQ